MLVKICGMKDPENIRVVAGLKPDMMGFIFYAGSPRYAGELRVEDLQVLPQQMKRVGVFVNQALDYIFRLSELYHLSVIQLHGSETPDICKQLHQAGLEVIKAIPIGGEEDFRIADDYQTVCDYLLFDTKSRTYGGSGKAFDWTWLESYRGDLPFLLSGGISSGDAEQLKRIQHGRFAGIDLNSRFEFAPGYKDPQLLAGFIEDLGF